MTKTVFKIKYKYFEFIVLPFGLTNASVMFILLINNIFHKYFNNFITVYLDNILIYSKIQKEHWKYIQKVLTTFKNNQLYTKIKKCELFKESSKYLEYIISAQGIAVDNKKIEVIRMWPAPITFTKIRPFLRLASYYHKFIKGFSFIILPLTLLFYKD